MTGLISPLEEPGVTEPELEAFDDLGAVRELVLKAHADVVPELVKGDSIASLLASVESAQTAYARIASTLKPATSTTTPSVPAGGNPPVIVDLDRLPASEKIKRGLATFRR
jgi:hypothetical protein